MTLFDGWDTYQLSLARAIAPLTPGQLAWRPAPHLRSAGEIASHISVGRISWFQRMGAPGSDALAQRAAALGSEVAIAEDAAELVRWLEDSWQMVEDTLNQWTVADLATTYLQPYQGKTYAVSRQWTIWRIIAHDLHHGGELAVTLGMQGIALPELGDLGGHLTEPPLAEGE
jgi:uncharacterized damage-inducible protein DinB